MTLPITIVMTTYFPEGEDGEKRRCVAYDAATSWRKYLKYSGPIYLHIADDGSDSIWLTSGWNGLLEQYDRVTRSSQNRLGIGASLNKGFRQAFEQSPLVFFAVDDWALEQPLDLDPWVQLLMERKDVGMVRLGPAHPGVSGHVEALTSNWQGWALRLDRQGFAFGHRPALYHKRFWDYYGPFDENTNALVCEQNYAIRFCSQIKGPDIVLALPHPFQHLDSIELAYLEPNES